MSAHFAEWNKGDLASYLIQITADILKKNDDKTDRYSRMTPEIVTTAYQNEDYSTLYEHFRSYGEITIYCSKHQVPLTRKQRVALLVYQWSRDHMLIRARL